jgi:hypothetical protein
MSSDNTYYVYAYLRSKDSMTAAAGTPYYVGKGTGNRAFVKHGRIPVPEKDHIVFLKENVSESEAHDYEIELIAKYGRKDLGVGILNNQTNGGEGISNPSQSTRNKLSDAKRNESAETRYKRSIAAKNRVRSPISEETKKKISAANTGKTRSDEAKSKMSNAKLGKEISLDHRTAISISLTGKSKPAFSDSHRENIGKVHRGKPWSDARRAAQNKHNKEN